MRISKLFGQTLREAPTDAEIASHQLLLRAGFIRQLAAGIFDYLPLARRSLTKIENLMRREIEAIGGQEITMPIVQPANIWKESRRWYEIDAEMGRFKDRSGREMALAMTHEEALTDLVRRELRSYRQLPLLLFHIQTKWRDDPRPRAGLIRVREFTMKDSYSLDVDWEGLDKQYRAHYQAYFNIFHYCGLPAIAVSSDVGMMGGKMAHEFIYLTPVGEDTLILCDSCGYAANRQIARFDKGEVPDEEALPLKRVATPGCKTIEELANFLEIPASKTAKAVFLVATIQEQNPGPKPVDASATNSVIPGTFVFAIVRGDMEVNETKLANALHARELRPATEDEIRSTGAQPGYASPVGLEKNAGAMPIVIAVDDILPQSANLVAGANEEGYHLMNVNYGRDYRADLVVDIASAQSGASCPNCGNPLRAERGVEIGNIFKLGTRYSQALDCSFLDQNGESRPVIMGSYGIGSGRLLACIAEEHHDDAGLIWPVSVAPYCVHLVILAGKDPDNRILSTAERLYQDLWDNQIETLVDDRLESPGVKFNDADLIGLPIRLTISQRSLKEEGIEFKRRDQSEKKVIPLKDIIQYLKTEILDMETAIKNSVVAVPFTEAG
jgi:prolyl-tRNA synthetase